MVVWWKVFRNEVCSLAGTLQLGKLVVYYDDNGISIDGDVKGWFSMTPKKRFEAYGWQVQKVDGHDTDAITQATQNAIDEKYKLTIICKTVIGAGSPNKQGKRFSMAHPFGAMKLLTRQALKWDHEAFELPDDIYEGWDCMKLKVKRYSNHGKSEFDAYKDAYPELASELLRRVNGDLPANFETQAQEFIKASR